MQCFQIQNNFMLWKCFGVSNVYSFCLFFPIITWMKGKFDIICGVLSASCIWRCQMQSSRRKDIGRWTDGSDSAPPRPQRQFSIKAIKSFKRNTSTFYKTLDFIGSNQFWYTKSTRLCDRTTKKRPWVHDWTSQGTRCTRCQGEGNVINSIGVERDHRLM